MCSAAGSTFLRFFPRIKARYDYGMVVFILTFCLVAVSGYRIEELFELAHQRLSTIILGAATCMVISIFICPVWAGEDLHKLIASNIEKLANYLEGMFGPSLIYMFLFLLYVKSLKLWSHSQGLKANIFIAQTIKKNLSPFFNNIKVFLIPKLLKRHWWAFSLLISFSLLRYINIQHFQFLGCSNIDHRYYSTMFRQIWQGGNQVMAILVFITLGSNTWRLERLLENVLTRLKLLTNTSTLKSK